jgi:hypothetical protein
MVTITNPRLLLGRWLLASPIADQTHLILRFDGTLLISYCGALIKLQDASKPVKGARHCVDCETLRRKHLKERNNHAAVAHK